MLIRESNPDRFKVRDSELFEAAFARRCLHLPRCEDIYHGLIWRLEHNPYETGVPSKPLGDEHRKFYTTVTPPITGMPVFRVLYEIDDENRTVILWNIGESSELIAVL